MSSLTFALRAVPKNLLSLLAGKLAFLPLPGFVLVPALKAYCRRYAAVAEEADRPLVDFRSLGDFFLRDLKRGARPIGQGIVSPVDGELTQFGPIQGGRMLQVKGREYTLARLVDDPELEERFRDGSFVTIYLAPGDYHHVHAPIAGTISESYHIPGTLWPVNRWSTENIDELFCVNERLITLIDSADGLVAVIAVGALNVGSIQPAYDTFMTNSFDRILRFGSIIRRRAYTPPIPVARGERLASFRLGSTVILLFANGKFHPGDNCRTGKILLGTTIGSASAGAVQ